jgi:hypothetical protein
VANEAIREIVEMVVKRAADLADFHDRAAKGGTPA